MSLDTSILCSEFINILKKYTPSTQWDIIFSMDCDNEDMNIHECIVQYYQDSYHYNIFMKHRDSEVDFYKKIIESDRPIDRPIDSKRYSSRFAPPMKMEEEHESDRPINSKIYSSRFASFLKIGEHPTDPKKSYSYSVKRVEEILREREESERNARERSARKERERDAREERAKYDKYKYDKTYEFIYDVAPTIRETNFKLMICENKNKNIIKYYIGLFRTI